MVMDFPLIPYGSLCNPLRERVERLPQVTPDVPLSPKTAPTQTLFIKDFTPIRNTNFIDVEFQEGFDNPSANLPNWPDFRLRNAFNRYYQATEREQQKTLSTVDLFV